LTRLFPRRLTFSSVEFGSNSKRFAANWFMADSSCSRYACAFASSANSALISSSRSAVFISIQPSVGFGQSVVRLHASHLALDVWAFEYGHSVALIGIRGRPRCACTCR
jgi:hypothetical protein